MRAHLALFGLFAASTLVASTILAATGLTTILFGEILGRAFYNVDHPSALGNILLLIPSVLLAAPIIVRLRRRLW